MDIHIDLEDLKMFATILVLGVGTNWYYYNKGLRRGWDDAMFSLEDENIIEIDDETGEIKRSTNRY